MTRIQIPAARRGLAGLVVAVGLGLALLTGCSADGVDTNCGLDECTLTFDRGVDAKASVLGVEAKLIRASGDQVVLEVAGEQVTMTVGDSAVQVGNLQASVTSVTDDQVVVKVSR